MPRLDHHIHTARYSPDSTIDPRALLAQARRAHLDGVVITEHDFQWEAEELEALRRLDRRLIVLAGVEVSAREGHFLVYGLPNLDDVPPGIALADLLAVVRAHRAAIVAAHPFRWGQDFGALIDRHGPAFDALELVSNNMTPTTRALAADLLQAYPVMGATGSSDAHELAVVGCYCTEFPGRIATTADFVTALRSRRGRPRHNPQARLSAGPLD